MESNPNKEGLPTNSKRKALLVAETAENHKANHLRILKVSEQCDYADYFIVMSATSTRHAQALADSVRNDLDFPQTSVEGYRHGEWIVLDLGDVMVHIFFEPIRDYYNFDRLWADAPPVTAVRAVPTRRTASRMPG